MHRIGLDACPYCGSLDVFRSHPKNLMDRACALLLLELARCHYCMLRYYHPILLSELREYSQSPKKPVRAIASQERRKRPA
jgi:hypothetical protein